MKIIRTAVDMTAWANSMISQGKTICLVPTMGYLHDGHLSLIRKGGGLADKVVVSIFVNPTQFGPGEDFESYPRDFERDAGLAEKAGTTVLFAPEIKDIYPENFQTTVSVKSLTTGLCGASRPGHFDGVTTVVAKLFNIVKPASAVFGQKDFQQLAVIKKMAADLNWDVAVISHPIVREADGLAMSSRNSYLSVEERRRALCLHDAVQFARARVRGGMIDSGLLKEEITHNILEAGAAEIDYVSIIDADTLRETEQVDENSVLALAVRIGRTRLIDNGFLYSDA